MNNIFVVILVTISNINSISVDIARKGNAHEEDILMGCHPNMIYMQENITCICNKDGNWPHENCQKTFRSISKNDVENVKTPCEPNGYIIIGCNVCRCNKKGNIDHDQCTQNVCHKEKINNFINNAKSRRFSNIYGSCKTSLWYSMAPCQYCYCVDRNKLICNSGDDSQNTLQLGSYKLTVCGSDFKQDIEDLLSNKTISRLGLSREVKNANKDEETDENNAAANIDDSKEKVEKGIEFHSKSDSDEKGNNVFFEYQASMKLDNEPDVPISKKKIEEVTHLAAVESEEDTNDVPSSENSNEKRMKINNSKKKDTQGNTSEDGKNIDLQLKIPAMLQDFINYAMRKSMMTLKPGNKCKPGSQTTKECNKCFCMKNGKMLCTYKNCK